MELTRNINGKLLRCGYTTGSCAAGAAKAAARMLLTGGDCGSVSLMTPKGVELTLDILEVTREENSVSCAVKKDSGDDPDATRGVLVYAKVHKTDGGGITIDGGTGVGRVTRPGLDQPVGNAAINSTPRRMIAENVAEECRLAGYTGGIEVIVSIPAGVEIAKRTFNPRMGIEGGLSVLGTSGIVEPMSNQALIDTITVELRQLAATGATDLFLTPGNYGEDFSVSFLHLSLKNHVSCSNFIGDALDAAAECGFKRILLVGHIGKLVKLGTGHTNTHSAAGDGRIETLLACALEAGAGLEPLRKILACVTTDAALEVLRDAGLMQPVMEILGKRIDATLLRRLPPDVTIGWLVFTNRLDLGGVLVQSENAETLLQLWREPQ